MYEVCLVDTEPLIDRISHLPCVSCRKLGNGYVIDTSLFAASSRRSFLCCIGIGTRPHSNGEDSRCRYDVDGLRPSIGSGTTQGNQGGGRENGSPAACCPCSVDNNELSVLRAVLWPLQGKVVQQFLIPDLREMM